MTEQDVEREFENAQNRAFEAAHKKINLMTAVEGDARELTALLRGLVAKTGGYTKDKEAACIEYANYIELLPNKHEKALAVAREALKWYGNPDNYSRDGAPYYQRGEDDFPNDNGDHARETISTIDEIVGKS